MPGLLRRHSQCGMKRDFFVQFPALAVFSLCNLEVTSMDERTPPILTWPEQFWRRSFRMD